MINALLILIGLVVLTFGAELLVRGASRLASAFGIPALVVGLTVVAFGTSAPELAVSVASSLKGQADVTVGNVVGSNIFNVLFILGLSAVVVPLTVDRKIIRFDVPLMIGVSIAFWLMAANGVVGCVEGIALFTGLIAYTVWSILAGRREDTATAATATNPNSLGGVTIEKANDNVRGVRAIAWNLVLVVVGLVFLVLGANWFVGGATGIARLFGVSELLIGLTIVAGGTSLPELATSIVAAIRGERDIAVGNVVGSNIFNILSVLGLSAVVAQNGVAVAAQALQFDIPVMLAVAVACLPIFFTGHVIARWEGLLFVAFYVAYTVTLVFMATNNPALPEFRAWMLWLVLPLTALTLAVFSGRGWYQWNRRRRLRKFAQSRDSLPRVVIIGGGFGGLSVAQHLKRIEANVTLIDRRNFHLFQPLLYQVATGSLSPSNVAAPLRNLLEHHVNTTVRMGEVARVDLADKAVSLRDGSRVDFEHLVVAAGVRHSYFGNASWEQFAPGLKTIEDATRIRAKVLSAFETAENERNDTLRKEWLTFVIVGGGPTGVELAGALAEIARYTLEFEFRRIQPADARVLILEAADRVLTMYPNKLSQAAQESLERLGVEVRTGCRVIAIDESGLTVFENSEEIRIASRTVLWAAGIEASPLARQLSDQSGAELDRAGRVRVESDLSLAGNPNVFVIGDMADFRSADGKPLPGIAPVAMQQGKFVAHQIAKRLRSSAVSAESTNGKRTRSSAVSAENSPKKNNLGGDHRDQVRRLGGDHRATFKYFHQGSLATIGRSSAVAEIGPWKSSGFVAWLIWLLIHVAKLNQLENRVLVFVQWSWSFLTFGRSSRLITGSISEPSNPDA